MEKARMDIEKNAKAELKKNGKVNDIDTGHSWDYKDESEATANPKRQNVCYVNRNQGWIGISLEKEGRGARQ